MNRFVTLDTETTGLNRKRNGGGVCDGHRVVEVGCVEIVGPNKGAVFHSYIQPGMNVDPKAVKVHGICDDFLKGMPTFCAISEGFLKFISGAILIIHNAEFDLAFLDKEFSLLPKSLQPRGVFFVVDTLVMARDLYPGLRNDLDSLCVRFNVVNKRKGGKHGALEDARLLGEIYLRMRPMTT